MAGWIKKRKLEPEEMDDPDLDAGLHREALRGLVRLNRWSFSGPEMFRSLRRFQTESSRGLRVLDIASGGGDVPLNVARLAGRRGLKWDVHGCDRSETAAAFAKEAAERANLSVKFFSLDIQKENLPRDYDVLTNSLFLHHLTRTETIRFLKKMAAAARRGIVIHDLERSSAGLFLAFWMGRAVTRSRVVHEDAPQSVRAAYSFSEIRRIAAKAGLKGALVERCWPFRYRIVWEKT